MPEAASLQPPQRPRERVLLVRVEALPGRTWSKAIATSGPRAHSISMTRSGERNRVEPSMWLRNSTAFVGDLPQSFEREDLEAAGSVRMGPSHPMNRCKAAEARDDVLAVGAGAGDRCCRG